jgi:amyloid beta precursor protein binding protein 1
MRGKQEFFICTHHGYAVIETHPENASDLRLDVPFPAMLEYVATFDFENMDSAEHGHVPFVVVLQHYLQVWKTSVSQALG